VYAHIDEIRVSYLQAIEPTSKMPIFSVPISFTSPTTQPFVSLPTPKDNSLGGLLAKHGLHDPQTRTEQTVPSLQAIPGISTFRTLLTPKGVTTERAFKRTRTEEQQTAVGRLCNLWGSEMPAVLEAIHDAIALVNRRTANAAAANRKFYKMLSTLGGGDAILGQSVMRTHMVEKLGIMPLQDSPFVYEARIMGVGGVPLFVQGSVVKSAQDEVVWSLSDVTELVNMRHSLQSLGRNYTQLHNNSCATEGPEQPSSSEIAGAATLASFRSTKKVSPAVTSAVVATASSMVPPAVSVLPLAGPLALQTSTAPPTTTAPSDIVVSCLVVGKSADWTAWSQPKQKQSAPSKTKTRRPYRFCSKCWLKHGIWALRSVKLPDGSIVNLNRHTNDTCPGWPEHDLHPTAEQTRAYGTAFKRAQRGSHLHSVAVEEFRALVPNMPSEELDKYLTG